MLTGRLLAASPTRPTRRSSASCTATARPAAGPRCGLLVGERPCRGRARGPGRCWAPRILAERPPVHDHAIGARPWSAALGCLDTQPSARRSISGDRMRHLVRPGRSREAGGLGMMPAGRFPSPPCCPSVAATLDERAGVAADRTGFVQSPDPATLRIGALPADDPAARNFVAGETAFRLHSRPQPRQRPLGRGRRPSRTPRASAIARNTSRRARPRRARCKAAPMEPSARSDSGSARRSSGASAS